ncbi:MAG: type I 3-dehydroquinate dehydratase [Acidobacteriota bacterium]
MMEPQRLCVTVTADTMAELRARRDAVADADLVELRLDGVRDVSVAAALAGRRRPVIVTCRPTWEGGRFDGSEETRLGLLLEAARRGAEYVDVEFAAAHAPLLRETGGRGLILSVHDFDGVPADLGARVRAMRATGAEIVKVAVAARRLMDCFAADHLAPARAGAREGRPGLIFIAMGEPGIPTRILPSRFGSAWAYAGACTEAGQLPATRVLEEFRFRRLGLRTGVYGVLGRPVAHSVSPAMHNAAFQACREDAVYLPLAAADFDDFIAFSEAIGLRGASVTAPFKDQAFERADACDPVSRRIRAVNTLRVEGRKGWSGCNTDVAGFLAPLERVLRPAGIRAVVLGAGGGARAAAIALSAAGAHVTVCARDTAKAEAAAALAGAAVGPFPPVPGTWDLLVNATPVGTTPEVAASPLPGGPFTGRMVYDLVYNPSRTRLLREAAAAGCLTLGGLEMLVAQAREQFAWWTGHQASEKLMRDAALARLDEMAT